MKKIVITITIILLSVISAKACEICGCGLGNYYIGLMPQFSHSFFGIRYQFRNFHTVIAGDNTQFSHDYYKTMEIWGGWNITRKWQVITLIPYNYIHQVSDDGITNNQGIGDIAAIVNYKIFDRISAIAKNKSLSQQLWIGAGIKLPTGKFNVDANDPELIAIANTQTGTASTDFMLNTMYDVRINKLGINTSAVYKINTSNNDKYSFGNKFSANSIVYYSLKKAKLNIVPDVGLRYEHTAFNTLEKENVAQTGGTLFSASAGLEFGLKKITVGLNMELPVAQNFSDRQTEMKIKGMAHISFSF